MNRKLKEKLWFVGFALGAITTYLDGAPRTSALLTVLAVAVVLVSLAVDVEDLT